MITSVFRATLWERRRSIVWWVIGMVSLAGLTVAFYPSIRSDTASFEALIDSIPEGLMSVFGMDDASALTTATGLVNSRLYSGIGPVILAVLGIGMGTAAIAGEEERGTLNLLMAQPVGRSRVIIDKTAAAVVLITAVVAAMFLTLLILNPIVELEFSIVNMLAANVSLGALTLVFFGLALAIGAITGNRSLTVGIASGMTAAAFFINGLAPLVDELAWMQRLTPFYWLQEPNPLANGFHVGWLALMIVVSAVLVVIAIWGFERRDIDV